MGPEVWQAIWVTLCLAGGTTALLFLGGVPLAYGLARGRFLGKSLIEAVVTLPLVLPPTVLGFYLLMAMGPRGLNTDLAFTFWGVLAGSVVFNLPFAVRPMVAAFEGVDRRLEEAGWSLGVGRWGVFWRVTMPLAWPGVLTGVVLTFAHTVGEFGVVLMLGGNRAGETQTVSVLIYDKVQALEYGTAHGLAGGMVGFAVVVLSVAAWLGRGRGMRQLTVMGGTR